MDRGREYSRLIAIELVAEGKRQGVTQKQIAEAVGVGEPQMSQYAKGKRGSMTLAHLVRGCEQLGVKPEVIAERAYANMPDRIDAGVVDRPGARTPNELTVVLPDDAPMPTRRQQPVSRP